MPDTITQQREALEQLNAEARKIIEAAEGEGRSMTEEESAKVDGIFASYDEKKAIYDREEKAATFRSRLDEHDSYMKSSAGRKTDPHATGSIGGGQDQPGLLELAISGKTHKVEFAASSDEHERMSAAYEQALDSYVSTGKVSAGLQTGKDSKGGYLGSMRMSATLIKFLDDEVFMRGLANVLPPLVTSTSLGAASYDSDPGDADWTPEVPASDLTEDDGMTFGKRELRPHLMSKLVKVSQKFLRGSAMSPAALVNQRLGYKMAVTEEKAFLTGNGAEKPLGVFTASNDGIPTGRDVATGSATNFTADGIMAAFYSLKTQYQARATWLHSRPGIEKIRKLKDNDGQYLWQPGLQGGQPSLILGRPYVQSEFVPSTFTNGNYVGLIGDFKTGYWIVDALSVEIQRLNELFAARNQVGFIGRKETDGMPVLGEAFARLKCST